MITTKKIPPLVEITVTPDNEYEYLRCDSSVAGLFFIRHKDGLGNIWVYKNDKGTWGDTSFKISEMRDTHTCTTSVVTEQIVVSLPTKKDYEASKYN